MESEKILLNVGIDEGEIGKAVKAIQDARKKVDDLKNSNKELEKQGKKNSETYILQENEIKNLNKSVAENSKVLQSNTSMIVANENSIEALRKANSALTKERNALNLNSEEGQKRIKEINEELDKNNSTIKENVSVLEQQKINIGNYSSALDNLVPGLGSVTNNITNISQAEGGFTKGMMGMVKASLAFIATPLGAVLAAIVAAFSLLSVFIKNSTAGMDLFEDATAVVSTVLNILIDRVVSVAKAIGSLLTFDLAGFAKNSQEAFSGLGDEIQREVGAALELADAIRSLEDAEINLEIAASKNENTIKRLLLESKNRTLSEKERIALLDQAMKIENQQTEQLLKNREEALRIANQEAAARVNLSKLSGESEAEFGQRLIDTGLILDDYRDKIKDALIARNNAEGQSLAFQEKVQNQRDALEQKAEDERQKRLEKERAAREKREEEIRKYAETEKQAVNEIILLTLETDVKRATSTDDRIKKEIALETVRRDILLQNEELTASERALINLNFQNALTEIELKGQADRKAAFDADNEQRAEDFDEMVEGMIQKIEDQTQMDINAEKEKYLNGLISREEYETQLQELELGFLIARQEINKQFGDNDLKLAGQITDAKIGLKQFERDTEIRLEQEKYRAVADVFGQTAGLFKKQTIAYKALASAQALIQTYQSAQAVFTGMTTSFPGPVGIALGIVAAVAAVASGLANVAKINNVKFKQGGAIAINGPDHSQGGVPLSIGNNQVAEVEGGEHVVVLKRGANEQLKLLSEANRRAGGKDFFTDRRPVRYAADGGFVPSNISDKVNATLDVRTLGRAFDNAISNLPTPVVDVTDINRVNTRVKKVEVRSELS